MFGVCVTLLCMYCAVRGGEKREREGEGKKRKEGGSVLLRS